MILVQLEDVCEPDSYLLEEVSQLKWDETSLQEQREL